jgi:hypothetical protein
LFTHSHDANNERDTCKANSNTDSTSNAHAYMIYIPMLLSGAESLQKQQDQQQAPAPPAAAAAAAQLQQVPMRAIMLALAVLLVLLGPAAATFGDNGLGTYTGRKRSPNTMVFGNDMVTEQALQATLNFAKDVLKGNWRPVKNDPPTPKREVRRHF